MAKKQSYTIEQILTIPLYNGLTDVVHYIRFSITTSEGDFENSTSYKVKIPLPTDPAKFVEYDKLKDSDKIEFAMAGFLEQNKFKEKKNDTTSAKIRRNFERKEADKFDKKNQAILNSLEEKFNIDKQS